MPPEAARLRVGFLPARAGLLGLGAAVAAFAVDVASRGSIAEWGLYFVAPAVTAIAPRRVWILRTAVLSTLLVTVAMLLDLGHLAAATPPRIVMVIVLWSFAWILADKAVTIERLTHAEARFRAIAENTPDIVFVQDRELRYEFIVNPQLGFTEQEFIGKTDRELFQEAEAAQLVAVKRGVLETGSPTRFEATIPNKAGGLEHFDGTYTPRFDASGAVNGVIGYFRNVTEQREAERQRAALARRNEELVEALGEIVFEQNVGTGAINWGGRTLDVLGYTAEEMPGTFGEWLNTIHPDDQPLLSAFVARTAASRDAVEMEYRARHRDGGWRWLHARAVPHTGKHGGADSWVGVVSDVSARRRAEDDLRASEQHAAVTFRKAAYPATLTDMTDARLVSVNEAFERTFGYAEAEAIGRTSVELGLWPPESLESRQTMMTRFASAGAIHDFEISMRTRSGPLRTFVLNVDPVEIGGRRILLTSAHDVTERKRMEEQLRASEERLRLFIEHAPAAIAIFDSDMRYLAASQQWRTFTGLGDAPVIGRSHHELFPAPERWKDAHRRALSGEIVRCEEDQFDRGDTRMWLRWEARPWWLADGAVGGVSINAEDITAFKLADERQRDLSHRLLKVQDVERRRIAKQLHDSTAQDVVGAMLQLDLLRAVLPKQDRKSIRRLNTSIAALERCATELRTLSYALHPLQLKPGRLAATVAEYARGFRNRTGIIVTLDVPAPLGELPDDVNLTLLRAIQECLQNVHRHAQSSLAIVRLSREPAGVVLEVRDAGRGFPAEALHGDGAPGAGLGLTSMRERLRHFGGSLEITSTSRGATVRAVVPESRL